MRMRHLFGIALAGAVVLGAAPRADAQFSMSLGNPYAGRGLVVGNNPYGYGAPGYTGYSSGYSGFAGAPVTPYYGTGYTGYAPVYGVARPVYPGYGVVTPGYYRPAYPVYRGRGWRRNYRW